MTSVNKNQNFTDRLVLFFYAFDCYTSDFFSVGFLGLFFLSEDADRDDAELLFCNVLMIKLMDYKLKSIVRTAGFEL